MREYDIRGQKKPVINNKILNDNEGKDYFQSNETYLSKIIHS